MNNKIRMASAIKKKTTDIECPWVHRETTLDTLTAPFYKCN